MRYVLKQKPQICCEKGAILALQEELGLSSVTASLLCARGMADVSLAKAFLHPGKGQLHDPFLFRDMRDAVSMIRHMIATKGKICIYGDYDADGTSACALLYRTLRRMGADVDCFLPSRMDHGYGLAMESIEGLKGTDLLITVDCGITNTAEIAYAHKLGMKTILTDHHECPHVLPKADFILNPKCPDETYPFPDLCGAGVAFKLVQALIGEEAFLWVDIAALATVADIVPLTGENRAIAAIGLRKMNEDPVPGIAALLQLACPKRNEIDAQTVSFTLAPRINAAGRISTARVAFDLLAGEDKGQLSSDAQRLCELNTERQQRQEQVVKEAMRMIPAAKDNRAIVLYKKDWDIGIVGLAASKIAETYTRPTVLLGGAETPGLYTGSARSIDGINIYEALHSQAQLFEKFGGHAGAAGLTIREENLKLLASRLNGYLREHYGEEIFRPVKYYDMEIAPSVIDEKLIREFDMLRPFGHKNEQVELLIRQAALRDIRPIGEDRHAKFVVEKNGKKLNGVTFGTQALDVPSRADIVGTLNFNSYDNKPQMIVGTFSFEENLAQRYRKAEKYLKELELPNETDHMTYFCEREKLLEAFVILRGISEQKISFSDMGAAVAFVQKYVQGMDAEKTSFAFVVLQEIGLLEIRKGDRIHIIIKKGKRDLATSVMYTKFG